ncbi:hypothetical protein KCP91_01290 [Microvirga sp. SRT01]|jgi:hypothetical protein|uniref:Uncharacterized protein n=1 Tax=Sphingomonas longa TaxID=2778730 RepID=A0ABS2D243_9SPHN|nr:MULTISPECIES: hypothetical protein [Alphaproteobacteria]MBM6574991.1 hypothetical protein [Sphingomonas sp. BT552]MBR7708042.1 hypothetical protein [Microvirga sp. SRT01]
MTDARGEGRPEDHPGTDPNTPPERRDDDARSDIEQAVESRSDAVERGEGGPEPETLTSAGEFSGVSGDGGVVKNQDLTQQ